MSRARDERGAILAMAAVMIPVFLLLTALVVDVGNWFTHDRQLQNRADAAAFAAGVEYAKNWKSCVYSGTDATLLAAKAQTAQEIADAARQYAGNPEASDYAGGVLPATLRNTEIADQTKLDVVINSGNANYDDDTDYTDGPTGVTATPCYNHPAGTDPDGLSPSGGHWTDVKVKERDLPSLFRTLGLGIGRAGGRARVDIRPAISGNRFLPLAVPNNLITKVQIRYYNECLPNNRVLLAKHDLAPLPVADQGGFAAAGGGMLWGLPVPGSNPPVGDKSLSFSLALPSYIPACGAYLPVGVEVRLASENVDIDTPLCGVLLASRFADCFSRISQIRVWNDGNADSQVRIGNVKLLGGCGQASDGYFGPLPTGATDCPYDVSAEIDWGTRDNPPNNVAGNFQVSANGTPLTLVSWNTPNGTAIYASSGGAFTAPPGITNVSISVAWADNNPLHSWGGAPCLDPPGPLRNPCRYNATELAHRTWVGTFGNAGATALVRTSTSSFVGNLPGPPFDNIATGGTNVSVFPTIGVRSVLKTGLYTTLRLDDPQANQTLQCDPDWAQGQEFSAFRYGCKPWYGVNPFTNGQWWNATTRTCPPDGQWFSYSDLGQGFGVNSSTNPWRCVLTAPGMSVGQVGDNIAVATQNCDNINNNSCQQFACNYEGNYDGKPGSPNGWWPNNADSRYPRVVNLFIVPYQSTKGLTGAGDEIPVLGFASFYVMDWTGSNGSQSDPCPDRTWDHDGNASTPQISMPAAPRGAITGVFVEAVDYEPGPVDQNATCVEGQLIPCRVTLVR